MPETRGEWFFFLVGVVAIGALAGFIVVKHRDATHQLGPSVARRSIDTPASQASAPGSGATPASGARVRLGLRATTDTWLSVHLGSAAGKTLYEGTLGAGQRRTFTGSQIWVRFGAAADLSATLNGHELPLPGGTYSAQITRSGLTGRSA